MPENAIWNVIEEALSELNAACQEDETVNHNRRIGRAALLLHQAFYTHEFKKVKRIKI